MFLNYGVSSLLYLAAGMFLADLRTFSAVFMVFVLLGLIIVSCFASYGGVESWGFAAGFEGRVFGSLWMMVFFIFAAVFTVLLVVSIFPCFS